MRRSSNYKLQSSRLRRVAPAHGRVRRGEEETKIKDKAKKIKLLIFDVDGVLTDGRIILDNEGNEFKAFHVRDGHGIKMIQRADVRVAIITGRESEVVDRRAKELGITEVFQGSRNKVVAYEKIKKKFRLSDDAIAYVGDDIVDIPLLKRAGLSFAVADAPEEVMACATGVTKNIGGRCAAREVTDIILKAKGLWKGIINDYLEA